MNTPAHSVVLVIDDEQALRRLVRIALEGDIYVVHESETGQEGLTAAAYQRPDIVILDLALPDMDGLEVLKRLREWSRVPVLVLSVRQDVQDKVAALDAGADDYLTKPFHVGELAARLRVLTRHSQTESGEPVFRTSHLDVDFLRRVVRVRGAEVHLTNTEYALLRCLIRYHGKIVTHRQLLREVWGPNAGEQSQYLRVYVNHLRKKLRSKEDPPGLILNEPGIGYRLVSSA